MLSSELEGDGKGETSGTGEEVLSSELKADGMEGLGFDLRPSAFGLQPSDRACRSEVRIMPQGMVVRNLSDIDLSTAANGNVGQAPSPYNSKLLLLKIPYRFNTGYPLLARSSACVLFDSFLSLGLQRSRP